MAVARKSGKAAEARDRARERANRFLEREQELLAIAEKFEEAQIELEGIDAATEAKIAKIREQAEVKVGEARTQAEAEASDAKERSEQLQREMLERGISRREVGERLGIPTRDVTRGRKAKPVLNMTQEEAVAAAKELSAENTMIDVPGMGDGVQVRVTSSDGPIVSGDVWINGAEQGDGQMTDVDLATDEWRR